MMAPTNSPRSERRASLAALVGIGMLLGAPTLGHAQSAETPAVRTARSDARAGTQSVGVPYTAIALQAGKDEQRLTGNLAYTHGDFTFDLKLSGANVAKTTQQSLLFDALGSVPGGQLSLGVTWSSFTTRADVILQVARLCAEQNKENGYTAEKDEDKAREALLAKDPAYQQARAAKDALEAEQKDLGDAGEARRKALEASKTASTRRGEAERLDRAADELAGQVAAGKDVGDALPRLQAALASARLAAARLAEAQVAALRAEEGASRAARLPGEIARAKEDLVRETKRATKDAPPFCNGSSELTAERDAQIHRPFHPTFVVALRGSVEAKSTDYFDPADAQKKTDAVYPLGAAVAAGVYPHPMSLLAVRLDYGRTRQANDPGSVCQNQPIAGKTTTPATYGCQSLVIGEPVWATKTALRAEYRQHVTRGVGLNPSFTYAWAGPETTPFGARKGSWSIDVPLYLRFKATDLGAAPPPPKPADEKPADAKKDADDTDPSTLAFGVALTHRQTWGLADKNQATDDVSVFLGGSFDLGLR
jgi:hypothetical protein